VTAADDRRAFHRVEYPGREGPTFTLGPHLLAVVDCSETGLRYVLPEGEPPPQVGSVVRGVVHFRDGTDVDVAGDVIRIFGHSAGIRFDGPGIPFATILKEQDYLGRRSLGRVLGEER